MLDMFDERLFEREGMFVDYLTTLYSETDVPDKKYLDKLDRIINEKPDLSSERIRLILLDILYFIDLKTNIERHKFSPIKNRIKMGFNGITKEDIIKNYFNKIFTLYEDKLSSEELAYLCMNMENPDICEKIIKRSYKKLRKEIRKTLYVPSRYIDELSDIWEINEWEVKPRYKDKHYEAKMSEVNPYVLKIFYKYFKDDLKYYIYGKIEKFDYRQMIETDKATLFNIIQNCLKNNYEVDDLLHVLKTSELNNIKLTNRLTKATWIKLLKNKEIFKKIITKEEPTFKDSPKKIKPFQDSFLKFLEENNITNFNIEKINVNKIDTIYCYEYLIAINHLSEETYNDNKKNYLFLLCFKLFLQEFLKEYEDTLTNKDLEYLERIFRRGIQNKNIYKILDIKNRKNLIHNYKTNDLLQYPEMVNINSIEKYSVKQYRNIKEIVNNIVIEKSNKKIFIDEALKSYTHMLIDKSVNNKLDEYILISLDLLDYDATVKLIKYNINTWKGIIDNIKGKSDTFYIAFKELILNLKEEDKNKILEDYSLETYISVFEKILVSGKKPTLNNINKVIKSIKKLLVPYNVHIEENLERLNYVAKGEPFLEKLNGIKLYEEYRKRLKSSIPDCRGKYNNLDYQLVDLHDKEIISNGIGKYLLPDNKKASSCLTPNGKAQTCLRHGAINPNGRFFKITRNGKIVAYSWVWRCGDVLCFDNIELTEEIEKVKDPELAIYEIYLQAAKTITEITRQEKNKGIKLVLIGRNPIDIKNKYIDNLKPLKSLSNNMFKPSSKEELYLKDSSENQVILYGEYSDKLDTDDVEPIYLYERPKVQEFKDIDEDTLEERINSIYYDYCLQNSIKYHYLENKYKSGYIGEDWFIGRKKDNSFDFFYNDNDKRLFSEAKKYVKEKEKIKENKKSIYIPKYKIENILDRRNISINKQEIEEYLKTLNNHDYKIPNTYYSHTTGSMENLNSVFRDGAITSSNYGNHQGGAGTNGSHYICIAKVASSVYESYKRTGTIILDDNMQIFDDTKLILPQEIINDFRYTSYPIRGTGNSGEYQVKDIITKEHFDSLLARKYESISLAQLILLNEAYDLNLPIILEESMSKIDTDFVKKYIKLNK